jgi:hypothetical protein
VQGLSVPSEIVVKLFQENIRGVKSSSGLAFVSMVKSDDFGDCSGASAIPCWYAAVEREVDRGERPGLVWIFSAAAVHACCML